MAISSQLGSSALLPAGLGFRNKIINGDMVVNQRATAVTSSGYTVDRWSVQSDATKSAAQSTDAPSVFTNSLKVTCTTGVANSVNYLMQRIEGYNAASLGWGTSSAKQVSLSFWVKSSLTGTYSVAFHNDGRARIYVATYSISASNTWEYKTLTIAGDSLGTWLKTTGMGIEVIFGFGATNSGYQTSTLNQWFAGDGMSIPIGPSTVPNVMATTGNIFAITGVQLEQNYQPTPFEQRPIGVELALCQRYYYRRSQLGGYNYIDGMGVGVNYSGAVHCSFQNPVDMRSAPVFSVVSGSLGVDAYGAASAVTYSAQWTSTKSGRIGFSTSGLTDYRPYFLIGNSDSTVQFNSEL